MFKIKISKRAASKVIDKFNENKNTLNGIHNHIEEIEDHYKYLSILPESYPVFQNEIRYVPLKYRNSIFLFKIENDSVFIFSFLDIQDICK